MLHRTTKGLTKGRLNEDLVLNDRVRVPGQVVQYLASFQLEGIRFLHQNYIEKSNCILNDDKYLGKCFQTCVFLSSIPNSHKSSFRCLILCKSREKLFNWRYHIELLTDLQVAEFKSIADFQNYNILVQVVEKVLHKQTLLTTKQWDYVILDETGETAFTDNDIALLNLIETKVKLIVSTKDITQNVRHLKRLLLLLNREDHENDVFKRIISRHSNSFIRIRELLICYCKPFILRRYGREISDKLPLTDLDIYQTNFNSWCTSKGFKSEERIETQINPKKDLNHLDNSEEMAPLVLESDTEDEYVDEIQDYMRFERRSSDVEILTQKLQSPITLSSENQNYRQSSPDLFESLDEDDSEKTTTYDLTGSLFKFKKKLNNEKVSTPITPIITASTDICSTLKPQTSEDLFEGITTMIEEEDYTKMEANGKLYEESNNTCVFEITKNDEFPNVIRINSDTEMSPLENRNRCSSKLVGEIPDSNTRRSFEKQKYNKNFDYFFDHDENDREQNSIKIIDEILNTSVQCVTPKTSKTPNTSGSSSNTNRWVTKSESVVKRKLSDSFEKIQSKRLKNHDITKLQDNSTKKCIVKTNSRAGSDPLPDSCSILFKRSKLQRVLSRSLASSDEDGF